MNIDKNTELTYTVYNTVYNQFGELNMTNSGELLEPLNTELLEVKVLERLRLAIQTNQLKPGQRLIEEEIARQMGVSRVPVRQAIHILERDGLVVIEPHRGATVVSLSDQDIEEIYGLRTALEIYAIGLVIQKVSESDIDALQNIVDQMIKQANQDPRPDQTHLDLKFHSTICELSRNRKLLDAWERLSTQVRMVLALKTLVFDDSQTIPQGHQRVVDAIRKRDVATAQHILSDHIAMSAERLRIGYTPMRS